MGRIALWVLGHFTMFLAYGLIVLLAWSYGDWRWAVIVGVVTLIGFEAGRYIEYSHADRTCPVCYPKTRR